MSQSARELQQVGVELENPGNVWGVVTPPPDWMRPRGTTSTMAQFAVAVAPAPDSPSMDMKLDEPPADAEHKIGEGATFPSPSPPPSSKQAPKLREAPTARRV